MIPATATSPLRKTRGGGRRTSAPYPRRSSSRRTRSSSRAGGTLTRADTLPIMNDIDSFLSYWLEPEPTNEAEVEVRKAFWFQGSADIDREIRDRFGALVDKARSGELDEWAESPRGTLALIILIDQFSRNLYRGTPAAFSCDSMALGLARRGYESGHFGELRTIEHLFAAMPFRHAED